MTASSTDQIRKELTLSAQQSRVWRALSDSSEFGEWFQVRLEGPFQLGESIRGEVTHPGCEHLEFWAFVERLEPEHCFAFRWHPHATDKEFDFENEPTTLVEFHLESLDSGTKLTMIESGFDKLPKAVRTECFMRNEGGWTEQMDNIKQHVDG